MFNNKAARAVRNLFQIPEFSDNPGSTYEDQQIRFLYGLLILSAVTVSFLILIRTLHNSAFQLADIILSGQVIVSIILVFFLKAGHKTVSRFGIIIFSWIAMTFLVFAGQGLLDVAVTGQLIVLIASALLLSRFITVLIVILNTAVIWILVYCHNSGLIKFAAISPEDFARDLSICVFLAGALVIYFSNIMNSSRKRILEELAARQKAEDALIHSERMAAVGTLTAGVAHQFNNINTSVLGFAQLTMMENNPESSAYHYADMVRKASLRAKEITSGLLSFSSQDAFEMAAENLVDITEETIGLVSLELAGDNINLVKKLNPVPDIMLDSAQISQVILNLLVNARHALLGRNNKTITVETGADNSWVWIKVEDNGCGILPHHEDRIFLPFFTTKGELAETCTAQSDIKGTGLGLSVSHTIAERHKGKISFETVPGKGTVFTLKMPLEKIGVAADKDKNSNSESKRILAADRSALHQSPSILIIEDEKDVRDFIERVMRLEKYKVSTAENGKAGIRMLGRKTFNLIILDIQMPEMNGFEFLKELSTCGFGPIPPIMVLTGKTEESTSRENLSKVIPDAEVSVYYKPLDLQELRRVTADLITKESGFK
ncbi:MAG: hybrid sensor histidine kinase/response regulator [Planctomycetota bacterium]|jgi:signal transduction histidine kinase